MPSASSALRTAVAVGIERFGHPLLLAAAFGLWWWLGRGDGALPIVLATLLLVMALLERTVPAEPSWRLNIGAKLRLLGVYLLGLTLSALLIATYESALMSALADVREHIGAAIWPRAWPLPVQIALLFFAADLIYYWIHRAIHRWPLLWRATGHGFHHAFHNLHAINAGSNHPFELVFVVLPLVLLAAATGAPGDAVGGAGVLLLSNAMLAHANVRMETPVFCWFVTCSNQHRRHHSRVFADSNTNFACNAIAWDRLFGTYSQGPVAQTGIGPTQPALWRMFLLPFVEPADADTVSTRKAGQK